MKNKVRNSSFELMRIIAMIMVCAYHWEIHGNHNGIIYSKLSVNQVASFMLGSWGTLGVNLFFMLSFYFAIKKNNVNYKRLIRLAIKVSFYGTTIVIIAFFTKVIPFDVLQLFKSMLGIFAFQYWFISVYLIIMVLAPFLNSFLKGIEADQYKLMLIILFIVTYVVSWIFEDGVVGRLSCALTIYCLLYYIENNNVKDIIREKTYLGYIFAASLIGFEVILSYCGSHYSIAFSKLIDRIQGTKSPIMLFIAIFIFYSFEKIELEEKRFINIIARYSSGAYFLHGGASFIKDFLWDDFFKAGMYFVKPPFEYVVYYVLCIMGMFFAGVLCEFLYSISVDRMLDRLLNKIRWVSK